MQLHSDEISVSAEQVQALVKRFLPEFADLPIRRVADTGTDHHLYRLGDVHVLRLPRRPGADAQIRREALWLPRLAPNLPLRIPEIITVFEPNEIFGHGFGLYRWIAGDSAAHSPFADGETAAQELAGFVRALRETDAQTWHEAPPRSERGLPLAPRDDAVHAALTRLQDEVDPGLCLEVWQDSLAAMPHEGPPVWLHGDLIPANLLCSEGRLCGVIDFGGIGIGDPAADLIPAWAVFDDTGRARYRDALGVDKDEWRRGRGWALSFALIALPYYRDTHAVLAGTARRTLAEIASDWRRQASS